MHNKWRGAWVLIVTMALMLSISIFRGISVLVRGSVRVWLRAYNPVALIVREIREVRTVSHLPHLPSSHSIHAKYYPLRRWADHSLQSHLNCDQLDETRRRSHNRPAVPSAGITPAAMASSSPTSCCRLSSLGSQSPRSGRNSSGSTGSEAGISFKASWYIAAQRGFCVCRRCEV